MGINDNSGNYSKKYALRIYTIIKNGPLFKSGAKELTDFIIPPEEVTSNQITFEEWVKTHSNQEIVLSLYSLLTKKFRDIKIKTNPLGSKEGILGASVQKENWTVANKKILHIISVKENSFAKEELGLIPNEDYIVGVKCKSAPIIPLNNDEFSPLEILSEVLRKNKGNPVKFYIYNKEKGPRDITANIKKDYNFSLGCEGAFGALHMFPSIENEKNNSNNDYNNKEIKNKNEKDENILSNESENKNENKDKNKIINLVNDNKEKIENNLNEEDSNINTVIDNNKEIRSNDLDNKNIDLKPSDNNINKIVEEISAEKELEANNSPKKENQNELNQENKVTLDIHNKKINEENEKKETKKEFIEQVNEEKKEEIKIEIIKENNEEEKLNKDENIEENKNKNIEEDKKEEKGEEKREEEKIEENKITIKEDKIEEKEEEKKEEDNKEENKEDNKEENKEENKNNNNENSNSNNKNKRRRKRNKH